MRVQQLVRYPVKSLQGEELQEAQITTFGLDGDRGWSLVDLETGKSLTARRCPELLLASAAMSDGQVRITLPDGTETDDDAALSSWLSRDVALTAAQPGQVGTYETQLDLEEQGEWFEWQGPEGSFHDSTRTRVSLVSAATFRDWDPRRFRINVILDAPGDDDLVGSVIAAGAQVQLDVLKRIDRCVVTTRPQPGGIERDLSVLKTIHKERGGDLGVGALVTQTGVLAVGDAISKL